jgi:hypothetical protein
VTLDDWILALHVLGAVALVAAMVVFWILVVAARSGDGVATMTANPISTAATVAVSAGVAGTLVFGVWLALSVGGYDLWDGWIVAALVLWAIGTETGRRSGVEFAAGRRDRGLLMHTISSIAIVLVLVDMVWKPGA